MKTHKQALSKASSTHAFSTRKHPVFGRGGSYSESSPPEGVINSPFYWWFKFLQLNDEYDKALKGKRTKIPREVLEDFGEVRNTDFKSWWQKRVHLFAEPPQSYRMMIANQIEDLAPFNKKDVINLVVPLNWTNVGIKRSFARVIDQLVPKPQRGKSTGRTAPKSEAKYKIGRKWSITGFTYAYKVYLVKQEANARLAKGGEKTPWADIGIQAGLPMYARYKAGKTIYTEDDIRRILTIHAKRHFDRAEAYIKATASHSFPS